MSMKVVAIEDIYQEILDGKRNRFPPNTWKEDIDNKREIRLLFISFGQNSCNWIYSEMKKRPTERFFTNITVFSSFVA
ncbi:hypothetical protein IIO_05794 [Bacillus cereus VD115]|nr:hypothetical protein IIO_05794 [Bacillus cereus VD115]